MQRGVACSPAAVCVTRPQGVPCQVQVRSNSHRRQRAAVALNCVPPGASAQLHGDDVTFGSRQGLHHANREDSPYDAESISSLQGGGLQGFYENRRREDEEEELDHHQSHHSQVSGLHGVSHATAAQAAPAGPSSQREPKYKTVMLKVGMMERGTVWEQAGAWGEGRVLASADVATNAAGLVLSRHDDDGMPSR